MPQLIASQVLTGIFQALAGNVDYLVLRNFEGLPDSWENDIDVLVAPEHLGCVVELVEQYLGERELLTQTLVMKRYGLTAYKIFCSDQVLRLDLFHKLCKAWIEYADVREILRGKRGFSEFFDVPCNNHIVLLVAAKEMFAYGKIRDKYNSLCHSVEIGSLRTDAQTLFRGRISSQGIDLILKALASRGIRKRPRPSFSSFLQPLAITNWAMSRCSGFVPVLSYD